MVNAIKTILVFALLLFSLSACDMGKIQEGANGTFGDQHFKTAIALIELHHTRFGEYPAKMDSIRFAGSWDRMAMMSVRYEKLDSGYALDLVNGWIGKPKTLKYPPEFWNGLGLMKSNMKK